MLLGEGRDTPQLGLDALRVPPTCDTQSGALVSKVIHFNYSNNLITEVNTVIVRHL